MSIRFKVFLVLLSLCYWHIVTIIADMYTCPCVGPALNVGRVGKPIICFFGDWKLLKLQSRFPLSKMGINFRVLQGDLTSHEAVVFSPAVVKDDNLCEGLLRFVLPDEVHSSNLTCPESCTRKRMATIRLDSLMEWPPHLNRPLTCSFTCGNALKIYDSQQLVHKYHAQYVSTMITAAAYRRIQECHEPAEWNLLLPKGFLEPPPDSEAHGMYSFSMDFKRKVNGLVVFIAAQDTTDVMHEQLRAFDAFNARTDPRKALVAWTATDEIYSCGGDNSTRCVIRAARTKLSKGMYFNSMPRSYVNKRSSEWRCVQRRPLRALSHALLLFDPTYVLIVDANTFVNTDLLTAAESPIPDYINKNLSQGLSVIGELRGADSTRSISSVGFFSAGAGYLLGAKAIRRLNSYAIFQPPAHSDQYREKKHVQHLSPIKELSVMAQNYPDCHPCIEKLVGKDMLQRMSNQTEELLNPGESASFPSSARLIDLCTSMMAAENTCYHSDHSLSRCFIHFLYGTPTMLTVDTLTGELQEIASLKNIVDKNSARHEENVVPTEVADFSEHIHGPVTIGQHASIRSVMRSDGGYCEYGLYLTCYRWKPHPDDYRLPILAKNIGYKGTKVTQSMYPKEQMGLLDKNYTYCFLTMDQKALKETNIIERLIQHGIPTKVIKVTNENHVLGAYSPFLQCGVIFHIMHEKADEKFICPESCEPKPYTEIPIQWLLPNGIPNDTSVALTCSMTVAELAYLRPSMFDISLNQNNEIDRNRKLTTTDHDTNRIINGKGKVGRKVARLQRHLFLRYQQQLQQQLHNEENQVPAYVDRFLLMEERPRVTMLNKFDTEETTTNVGIHNVINNTLNSNINQKNNLRSQSSHKYARGDGKIDSLESLDPAVILLKEISRRRIQECFEQIHWNVPRKPFNHISGLISTHMNMAVKRKVHGLIIWIGSNARLGLIKAQYEVLRKQAMHNSSSLIVGWTATEVTYGCRSDSTTCPSPGGFYFHEMPWTYINSMPEGWRCAQRRPLRALAHVLLLYEPSFVLMVDDDTFVNTKIIASGTPLDHYIRHNLQQQNMVIGELQSINVSKEGFYYGGSGYLFGERVVNLLNSHLLPAPPRSEDAYRSPEQMKYLSLFNELNHNGLHNCPNCLVLSSTDKSGSAMNRQRKRALLSVRLVDLCVSMLSDEHTCLHSDHALSRCLIHGVYVTPVKVNCAGTKPLPMPSSSSQQIAHDNHDTNQRQQPNDISHVTIGEEEEEDGDQEEEFTEEEKHSHGDTTSTNTTAPEYSEVMEESSPKVGMCYKTSRCNTAYMVTCHRWQPGSTPDTREIPIRVDASQYIGNPTVPESLRTTKSNSEYI